MESTQHVGQALPDARAHAVSPVVRHSLTYNFLLTSYFPRIRRLSTRVQRRSRVNVSGVVTPSLEGYLFIPGSRAYHNLTTNLDNQNFQGQASVTISGWTVPGAVLTFTNEGGGILATVSVIWWMKKRGLPVLRTADVIAPAVALGAALTRVGCFLNGCCFGQETSWFWGVHFPPGSFAHQALGDVHVHPTQLLQSAWGFLVFLLLSRLGLQRRPGTVFWSMVILIPAGRITIDFIRYHSPTDMVELYGRSVPDSFILAWALMILGIVGFAALRGRRKGDHP